MELATTRKEAMPKGATIETSKAAVGFEYCNKLFAMERKYADYPSWQRELARQAFEEPLLDAYWSWVEKSWTPRREASWRRP